MPLRVPVMSVMGLDCTGGLFLNELLGVGRQRTDGQEGAGTLRHRLLVGKHDRHAEVVRDGLFHRHDHRDELQRVEHTLLPIERRTRPLLHGNGLAHRAVQFFRYADDEFGELVFHLASLFCLTGTYYDSKPYLSRGIRTSRWCGTAMV